MLSDLGDDDFVVVMLFVPPVADIGGVVVLANHGFGDTKVIGCTTAREPTDVDTVVTRPIPKTVQSMKST